MKCRGLCGDSGHSSPPPTPVNGILVLPVDRKLFGELVSAGFRTLAMRFQPARPGGDIETIKRLNALVELVREQL